MTEKILVAYATQHGSTQEVAEAIGATLREHGLEAEVQSVHQVHNLDGYSAVVLGAPFYLGRWLRDARHFLKKHRVALAKLPIAIFALGPRSEVGEEIREVRAQLDKALAAAPWITPVEISVFGGKVDPASLHFPFNHMEAVDARNWTAIHSFAEKLAQIFHPSASSTSEVMSG